MASSYGEGWGLKRAKRQASRDVLDLLKARQPTAPPAAQAKHGDACGETTTYVCEKHGMSGPGRCPLCDIEASQVPPPAPDARARFVEAAMAYCAAHESNTKSLSRA